MYAVLLLLVSHGAALDGPVDLSQRQQPSANFDLIDPVLQPYCTGSSF